MTKNFAECFDLLELHIMEYFNVFEQKLPKEVNVSSEFAKNIALLHGIQKISTRTFAKMLL